MNIRFDNKAVDVRALETYPSRFKLGDYIQGPQGILKVVTVQNDVPYFENLSKKKTVVVFVDESGQQIPVNGLFGKFQVFRPQKVTS